MKSIILLLLASISLSSIAENEQKKIDKKEDTLCFATIIDRVVDTYRYCSSPDSYTTVDLRLLRTISTECGIRRITWNLPQPSTIISGGSNSYTLVVYFPEAAGRCDGNGYWIDVSVDIEYYDGTTRTVSTSISNGACC